MYPKSRKTSAARKAAESSQHFNRVDKKTLEGERASVAGLVSLLVGGLVLAGSLFLVVFAGRVEAAQPGADGPDALSAGLWLLWTVPLALLALLRSHQRMQACCDEPDMASCRPMSMSSRPGEPDGKAGTPGSSRVGNDSHRLDEAPETEEFLEALDQRLRNGRKQSSYVALALVNVDSFSAITDEIGQAAANERLRQMALSLHSLVRSQGGIFAGPTTEIQARYSVLLPNTDPDLALQLAEDIRMAVVDLGYDNPTAPHRIMTASLGLAVAVPDDNLNSEGLCKAAQQALQRSSLKGGNRVELAMLGQQPGSLP